MGPQLSSPKIGAQRFLYLLLASDGVFAAPKRLPRSLEGFCWPFLLLRPPNGPIRMSFMCGISHSSQVNLRSAESKILPALAERIIASKGILDKRAQQPL